MNQTARIISIYAADTSGFCSALYEYGGMSVIHDASGCNSTYTTHDEPRWYDMDSMMYISGLTESDAVMGNDEKFISDLCLAAEELNPKFVAICASALPAMVGIDMQAIAYEVESRTGIPSFEVKTNAMQSYITGAANAFVELARRFALRQDDTTDSNVSVHENKNTMSDQENESSLSVKENGNTSSISVNILGLTPLDFPLYSTTKLIRQWLESEGFTVNAFVGMDTDLEDIRRLPKADVNLVISSIGRPLADYLMNEYGLPYVIGTPYGKSFAGYLADKLKQAAADKKCINAVKLCREETYPESGKNISEENISEESRNTKISIIGESILSTSLAAALLLEKGVQARVLESIGDGDMSVLRTSGSADAALMNYEEKSTTPMLFDVSCTEENELENELSKSDIIIADPLFEPICGGKHFIRLPHRAFSGRTFDREEKQLIGDISYVSNN